MIKGLIGCHKVSGFTEKTREGPGQKSNMI